MIACILALKLSFLLFTIDSGDASALRCTGEEGFSVEATTWSFR